MDRDPAIVITENGAVTDVEEPILHPQFKVGSVPAWVKVRLGDQKAQVRALLSDPGIERMVIGRSAVGQLGFEVERDSTKEMIFTNGSLQVPILVTGLSQRARTMPMELLRKTLVEKDEGREIARLCLVDPNAALTHDKLQDALMEGEIDLNSTAFIDDGRIVCPLENMHYTLSREGMDLQNPLRELLKRGRKALEGILTPQKFRPDIPPRDVLVGEIKFFSYAFHGLLDRNTGVEGTFHESMLLFDANRNDEWGNHTKQVEIANLNNRPITKRELNYVTLRLFRAA